MNTVHDWLGSFSARAWPAVADHLWQTTLLVLIVWLTAIALKSGPARTRHALWLIASLKFAIPSALLTVATTKIGISLNWLGFSAQPSLLEGITIPASLLANSYSVTLIAQQHSHHELFCAFSLVWLAGLVTLLSAWGIRVAQLRQTMNRGQIVTQGAEWHALQQARETLNLRKDVKLVISSRKTEPAVFGSWKPVIVLPESVTEHLTPVELQAIMLHELIHVQRRDNPIGKAQLALSAVFWFHPLIWFIGHKLSDEREQTCDERVLQLFGDRETYAASILKVVRFSFGWKVAGVAGAGSGSNLRRRIENIMSTQSEKGKVGIRSRLIIVAFAGVALALVVTTALYGRARTESAPRIADSAISDDAQVAAPVAVELRDIDQKRQPAAPPAPPNPTNPPNPPAHPQAEDDDSGPPTEPAQPANAAQPVAPALPVGPANEAQPAAPSVPPVPPARAREPQEKDKPAKRNVHKGELIEAPPPVYPEEARKQKVEGTVTVTILIDEDGKVITAKPASGPEPLHEASREAAFKARFKPTLVDGKPAKVAGAMTYNFVLDKP